MNMTGKFDNVWGGGFFGKSNCQEGLLLFSRNEGYDEGFLISPKPPFPVYSMVGDCVIGNWSPEPSTGREWTGTGYSPSEN